MAVVMPVMLRPRILPARMLIFVALHHPLFLNKIHRLSASVVSAAMLIPLLLVSWWNIQINRLAYHSDRLLDDDHRLLIHDDGRWSVADIDSPVYTGLVDADRDAHGRLCDCPST